MNLEGIEHFAVSAEIVERTERSLRRAGEDGYELFVLWSGVTEEGRFCFRTAHVPKQTSYRSRKGLLVRVDGEALHKLNSWLYESGEMLAGQVHAHPTDAFHSETDDCYPIVTALGGLSIVAPDFAVAGLWSEGTAVFRLAESGWLEVPHGGRSLIEVIP
jgi:hypothetical protein